MNEPNLFYRRMSGVKNILCRDETSANARDSFFDLLTSLNYIKMQRVLCYTNHTVAQRQSRPGVCVSTNETAIVALSIGRLPESQTLVEISADPGAPCLHHHVGRDEFMVRDELHVVIDSAEG